MEVTRQTSYKNYCRGKGFLGKRGGNTGSVKQVVHDGDTVAIEADGNIGVRFLGIDTPEVSLKHPTIGGFPTIYPNFTDLLTDPFSTNFPDSASFKAALGPALVGYLNTKLGPDCAKNHDDHAEVAHRELEKFIQDDINKIVPAAGKTKAQTYKFFLAFSYEIMDYYGRFLCFVHQDLPKSQQAGKISYNQKMLVNGFASPYFIFPNIEPFRTGGNIVGSIPDVSDFSNFINSSKLKDARDAVKSARTNQLGIFSNNVGQPLMLEPFELRYLSKRSPPSRWVIDMSSSTPSLIAPCDYHTISYAEDRLFINSEHLLLFRDKGY